ncbi:MAG: glycosyltransferase, partial [Flavobacteriaceae bacterium]|nr:glycosyltransferase [Flavobacteriaceae bacterium]
VICTFNGKHRLPNVLSSIIRQEPSVLYNFELIIVDNLSTDATAIFCSDYLSQAAISFPWKIVTEKTPGLNHARLKGLKEAQHEFVLFCDDDNVLSDNYLNIASEILLSNSAIGALGGCGIPIFDAEKPEWFDRYSYSFAVGAQASQDGFMIKYPSELYGAGTFFRKSPLLELFHNGFKTIMSDRKGNTLASGGDVEWCYLIQLLGYKLYYDHRLVFWHHMPQHRMHWEYYLRLKKGISSGVCNLLPYGCLFRNRKMSSILYLKTWFTKMSFALLIYFKLRILAFVLINSNNTEQELAITIWREKLFSYWQNSVQSHKHFIHLKNYF